MGEFEIKLGRIEELLSARGLDALLLQRVSSFAWATCGGASFVNQASTTGAASLLISPHGRYLITNNIEAQRLESEEGLAGQGWMLRLAPWNEPNPAIPELTAGLRLGADGPFPGAMDLTAEMARLRANLLPEEGERFRALGRLCAEAMEATIRAVRPGQTEYEIAARLAAETITRGMQNPVNLIATDERIYTYRHPLPKEKKLERYAELVLCGRKWGLVCSITRLVHFGPLPDELARKERATAQVDATFHVATRPGATLSQVFGRALDAYAAGGFPDEWQLHHQGGVAGYESREYLGTASSKDTVAVGQAYAWNPSITGVKSEDTLLVGPNQNEVLTAIRGWPALQVTIDGQMVERPAILRAA